MALVKFYFPIYKVLEKMYKCFQIFDKLPKVALTPIRAVTNHHWLNHLKIINIYKITLPYSLKI